MHPDEMLADEADRHHDEQASSDTDPPPSRQDWFPQYGHDSYGYD
jgi:hypothetical protein